MKKLILHTMVVALLVGCGSGGSSDSGKKKGREGGGGGGIVVNGKIYTLSEAGLKVDGPENPFYLDSETVNATTVALEKINSLLSTNLKHTLYLGIFGNDHLYQNVTVADTVLFEQMKAEYKQYVDTLPIQGKFVLPAYTSGKVTFLFPDFFAADPGTRALYLIHESAFFLRPTANLGQVLRFEVATSQFLTKPGDLENQTAVLDSLLGLELISRDINTALYLKAIETSGKSLFLSHFILPQRVWCIRGGSVATDAPTLTQGNALEPSFFRHFYRSSFSVINISCAGDSSGSFQMDSGGISLEVVEEKGDPVIVGHDSRHHVIESDGKLVAVDNVDDRYLHFPLWVSQLKFNFAQ